MPETTTYDRPVKATLVVQLDNGETFEATSEDLAKFGLVQRHDAYMGFQRTMTAVLTDAGLLDDEALVDGMRRELVDAELNPVRHLAEVVLLMPELAGHPDYEKWQSVVELERRLRVDTSRDMLTSIVNDWARDSVTRRLSAEAASALVEYLDEHLNGHDAGTLPPAGLSV